MKLNPKLKKNLKIIICTFFVICVFFVVLIIVQTIVINKKSYEVNDLKNKNNYNQALLKEQEAQIEYFESDSFKDDYMKYELENNDNNVIYK